MLERSHEMRADHEADIPSFDLYACIASCLHTHSLTHTSDQAAGLAKASEDQDIESLGKRGVTERLATVCVGTRAVAFEVKERLMHAREPE